MFDSLIETRRGVPSSQRLVTLPFVVSLHAAVLAAILIHRFLEVPEIQEPPLRVSFARMATPPPPPPPPPKAAAKPETPKPKVETPKPEETQPVEVPKEIPEDTGSDAGGVEGGSPEGVEGGEIGGVPGGVLGGIPSETPTLPTGPLRIGGDVTAPVLSHRVQPRYPQPARSAKLTGTVILEAVIRKDGSVGDIRVLKGLGMGCTEAAVEAVRQWRYQPGTQHGLPVDVYMNVRVTFELN